MGPNSPAIDGIWPPAGIETFDPWHLPLINTLILLCSGCAATWAHHALVHENNRKDLVNGLILAVALGALYTVFQAYEYGNAAFGYSENIYGKRLTVEFKNKLRDEKKFDNIDLLKIQILIDISKAKKILE